MPEEIVSVNVLLPNHAQYAATVFFALAILHTFCVRFFARWSSKFPKGSLSEKVLHLLSEVEIVLGVWAGLFTIYLALSISPRLALSYIEARNYTEPLFVFVIMTVCATKPVLDAVGVLLELAAQAGVSFFKKVGVEVSKDMSEFLVIMIFGPLLGSLITEPAAMTVCALMLLKKFFDRTDDISFKYAMLGLLFVNISIGGTLTSFAAPPVLMVAGTWKWDSLFMLQNFGWKATFACVAAALLVAFRFKISISHLKAASSSTLDLKAPLWLTTVHLSLVALIVFAAHHPIVFFGFFLLLFGVTALTKRHQTRLKLGEAFKVGFFLAGLVILGGPQGYWLEPLLSRLASLPLFLGAMGLTALTDNAALTYLGSLVPDLSDSAKYALVAGAVAGGGLTVIANAPNPAGYGILNGSFGHDGISPGRLFVSALLPTAIAAACLWFL